MLATAVLFSATWAYNCDGQRMYRRQNKRAPALKRKLEVRGMLALCLHGDSLELKKTLPDKSVDLFLCDLPYGCLSGGGGKEKKENAHTQRKISEMLNSVQLVDVLIICCPRRNQVHIR